MGNVSNAFQKLKEKIGQKEQTRMKIRVMPIATPGQRLAL